MVQLLLWWLFHTIAVFRRVNWQFHSSKVTTSKKNVYHHFTFVLASLILPAIPVLVIMFVPSDYKKWLKLNTKGFTITRSPPFVCTGFDTHTNFWAAIFPVSLVLATGATILVLILRIVFKVQNINIVDNMNYCYYFGRITFYRRSIKLKLLLDGQLS